MTATSLVIGLKWHEVALVIPMVLECKGACDQGIHGRLLKYFSSSGSTVSKECEKKKNKGAEQSILPHCFY